MSVWNAVAELNMNIKEIKEMVEIKKHFNKNIYDKDSMTKLRILR